MASPAASAQFGAAGVGLQKSFGGSATPQEQQMYASNPAAFIMAPFLGLTQSAQGQSQPAPAANPTAPAPASPGVPARVAYSSSPPPGRNPTNTGQKTLLGQ
jgi:hypothetical protein